MQNYQLAHHLSSIEDLLLQGDWHSWDFELTNTTNLYAPWSNPPLPDVTHSDRVIARYILKNKAGHPVAFCVAEVEAEDLQEIESEREFHKSLAEFHAALEQLPIAMYTYRGLTWDYMNIAADEDWHGETPPLSEPLNASFVEVITEQGFHQTLEVSS
jgi:hypothetical protein